MASDFLTFPPISPRNVTTSQFIKVMITEIWSGDKNVNWNEHLSRHWGIWKHYWSPWSEHHLAWIPLIATKAEYSKINYKCMRKLPPHCIPKLTTRQHTENKHMKSKPIKCLIKLIYHLKKNSIKTQIQYIKCHDMAFCQSMNRMIWVEQNEKHPWVTTVYPDSEASRKQIHELVSSEKEPWLALMPVGRRRKK